MIRLRILLASVAFIAVFTSAARDSIRVDYRAELIGNGSTGNFAPYMIGSWNSGRIIGASGIWQDGMVCKEMTLDRRFNWGAGIEYIAGYGTGADYEHYSDGRWGSEYIRQSSVRLIQLWGEIKYRGVFLQAGAKVRKSKIVDDEYSMGDLVRSTNARPIPGISAGFVDFQDIPFTKGWVQINGELMYGKFFDSALASGLMNHYNDILPQKLYYHYKYCYFRTKPSMPFSVTVGVQEACLFGGSTEFFFKGGKTAADYRGFKLSYLWNAFFAEYNNGEGNAIGSSLGSWDLRARYRFRNGYELSGYFQWFWEDGSGLSKRNGWDGLWGVQLKFPKAAPVDNIVVEYLDFTNQAGPAHHWPTDWPGTNLDVKVGGADNYYNNDRYGPYAYYGMAIGTPFVKSPIYNLDGYYSFANCRTRGFHAAFGGTVLPNLSYRFKFSSQIAWRDGRTPSAHAYEDYSAGLHVDWQPMPVKVGGLSLGLDAAFDLGKLRGDNFGAMLAVRYEGSLNFKR